MLVSVFGYLVFTFLQPFLPPIYGKMMADLDTWMIPNEKTTLSEREILSQKSIESPELPSYLVCSINDDPEGINSYGIYDPTDLAVTVNNLIRLDIKHLFLGTHLHWPDLPEVENNTLNSQLESLESCILSVPLRRTAESAQLPDYLLASSIPLAKLNGNSLTIPRVNNVSLAPTLKIPKNCKVGFSQLESEPKTDHIPLLAVWGERVILSSLLLERIHHLKLDLYDIKISVGKFISLGDIGNLIPIDEFGHFSPTSSPVVSPTHIISADITSIAESPVKTSNAVLTSSGAVADKYRAIEAPVKQLAQLTLTPVFQDVVKYQRIWWWAELVLTVLVAFLLAVAVRLSLVSYWLWIVVLMACVLMSSISLCILTTYFMPISHVVLSLVICMCVFPFLKSKANYIYELQENQHDLGDLSILYKEEQFTHKQGTLAQLSARERRQQRHLRSGNPKLRPENQQNFPPPTTTSSSENDHNTAS